MNPPPNTVKLRPLKPAASGAVARGKSRVCTREACENCREKKAKCNGKSPCPRCVSRGLECRYESRTHQTKRSLRAELRDLREGLQHRDAVLAALVIPSQTDGVLRRLRGGSTITEIYNLISAGDVPEFPTALTPALTEEGPDPESIQRAVSTSTSSPQPPMSLDTAEFGRPGSSHARESFEHLDTETDVYHEQHDNMSLGAEQFGPGSEELAAANCYEQLGYDVNAFASAPFISPPLQSLDISMVNDLESSANGEYHQPMTHSHATGESGPANWWACGGVTPAISSFSGMPPTDSFPRTDWYYSAPIGWEPSGSYSILSTTASAMASPPAPPSSAPSSPPPREPVQSSVPPTPASNSPNGQSPPENHRHGPEGLTAADAHRPRPDGTPPTRERQRQRRASARNWQRQKRYLSDLQDATAEAEASNKELRRQYSQVLAEVLAVKEALMGHAGCGHPGISSWLQSQANSFVANGTGARGGVVSGSFSPAPTAGGREEAACRS